MQFDRQIPMFQNLKMEVEGSSKVSVPSRKLHGITFQEAIILIFNRLYMLNLVRFEVFMAVTMKKAVFWDVAPCRSGVN
jgi:hypothetical protein